MRDGYYKLSNGYYRFIMPSKFDFNPAGFVLIKKDGDRWYEWYAPYDGLPMWFEVCDIEECITMHKYPCKEINIKQVDFYKAIF